VVSRTTKELISKGKEGQYGRKVYKPTTQYLGGVESITKLGGIITPKFSPPFSYWSLPYVPFLIP
jgi:hypothetical protein